MPKASQKHPEQLAQDVFARGEDPWFPAEHETARQYYSFKAFLDMGPSRNLDSVSDVTGIAIQTVRQRAKLWRWVERAEAYDKHLLALEFQTREDEIVRDSVDWEKRRSQVREQSFQVGAMLLDKAREMLKFPLEVEVETTDIQEDENGVRQVTNIVRQPAKWSFRDAALFIETADKLQRLGAEMTTSNKKVEVVERRVELTVKMLVQLASNGMELDAAKRRLLDVGMAADDVEAAARQLLERGVDFRRLPAAPQEVVIEAELVEPATEEQ